MKTKIPNAVLLACAGFLILTGVAMGDSLSVTSTAAMGGTAQNNCSGDGMPGPCGLQVFHDNSSSAFVEDRSPNAETVYRGTFLFDPNNISPGKNLKQRIFQGLGANPNPGVGNCSPTAVFQPVFELWLFLVGGAGQNYVVQFYGLGNQCGPRATGQFLIADSGPVRFCFEYEAGNGGSGRIRLATESAANPCPPSGDPAYSETALSNGLTSLDRVRMGIPSINQFGAGESGNLFFDEFESFRTLAP